jgi:hypothetical protein
MNKQINVITISIFILMLFSYPKNLVCGSYQLQPAFFRGELTLSPVPIVGQRATLSLLITPVADSCEDSFIIFRVPREVSILEQWVYENQYLIEGSSYKYSTDILILSDGSYSFQATVQFQLPDGRREVEHFFIYLEAGKAESRIQSQPRCGLTRQKLITRKLLAPAYLHYSQEDSLAISGRITYYDDNLFKEIPIRGVLMELVEISSYGSITLGSTHTDAEGLYHFGEIVNIDPEDNTALDIQLNIVFRNHALKIVDNKDITYSLSSSVENETPGGNLVRDYYLDAQNQNRALGYMFNRLMNAYEFLQHEVGWSREQITIKWQNGDKPAYDYRYTVINGAISEEYIRIPYGWEWGKTVLIHEYGHAVMMALYGYNHYNIPQSPFKSPHSLCTVSDVEFAFREGWSQFFEAVVDDSAFNVSAYAGRILPNIETNDWWTGDGDGKGDNIYGEIVEGAVASILWDIADIPNSFDQSPGLDDDEINGMFPEVWALMMDYKPTNIMSLWEAWIENGYDQAELLYSVYQDHGVAVPEMRIAEDEKNDESTQIATNKLSINSTEAYPGEYVTIRCIITESMGIASCDIIITYDADVLEAIQIKDGELTRDRAFVHNTSVPGEIELASFVDRETQAMGVLAEMEFKISVNAKPGIAASLEYKRTRIYDKFGNILPVEWTNGVIEIIKHPPDSLRASQPAYMVPTYKNELYQNFPNPFNPGTWIPYQLKEDCYITIRIFNMRGEMVTVFDLGFQKSGIYMDPDKAVYWDGRADSGECMASGIYLYSITAGNYNAVKKLTLVR